MRTTLQTIHDKILYNLNRSTEEMSRLNQQISSEKRIARPADAPTDLAAALGLRSSLAEIDQYKKNLTYAGSFIDAAESALTQMKEGVMRAKVLAINGLNAAMNTVDRANMAQEIGNIFQQAVTLANTQVNGKYVFGGFRTSGYDELEPAPFVIDQADGFRITANEPATLAPLTGTVDGSAIAAGDLTVNGVALGAVAASGGATNGLYMDKAMAVRTAVNTQEALTGVRAALTTLYAGGNATDNAASDVDVDFQLNGVAISLTVPAGATSSQVAATVVAAINDHTGETGVVAEVGDTTNGGAAGSVVFRNASPGDESTITVSNFNPPTATALVGFGDFSQAADASHNTGEISLTGTTAFTLASPNATDDSVLAAVGLDGGGQGFADDPGDGEVRYGHPLAAGELVINGIGVPAAADDGLSDVYADGSAAAKAMAINAVRDQTGVSAVVVPPLVQGSDAVQGATLDVGDLVINGVDIFATATVISDEDSDNALVQAINAKSGSTGVVAGRTANGHLFLTTVDDGSGLGLGRNIHITTSAKAEAAIHLNGTTSRDRVYFGAVQLRSDQPFTLSTTPTPVSGYEPGLAAVGLEGGANRTGEEADLGGDGTLTVRTILGQEGNVRYAGDPDHDLAVKVGKRARLEIAKNGNDALKATGVFTALKDLERRLLGSGFTAATGVKEASSTTATLDSGLLGLEGEEELQDGSFKVTVTDTSLDPPRVLIYEIPVSVADDTADDVAARIDAIPGISAAWNSDGALEVQSDDSDRFTFTLTDDSSHFLRVAGIDFDKVQTAALSQSLAALDAAMDQLNNQIADFGSRANRITIQSQIYDNLELAGRENLSELEDTDLLEALMRYTSRETAYQAALSSAARVMQLSLVNFL